MPLAAKTSVPRSPDAAITDVLKDDWPEFGSEIEIVPVAVSFGELVSSVTLEFVGVPITAFPLDILISPRVIDRSELRQTGFEI